MNAVLNLESMGLTLSLDSCGGLSVDGLHTLTAENRRNALALAKDNKHTIVEELRRRSAGSTQREPVTTGNLPAWIRAHVPGEVLDDSKERRCKSKRCGAVFMRTTESDESWKNKRYCSAECWNGKPFNPEQIAYAENLIVDCPTQNRKLHCWRCADCETAHTCTAWRSKKSDVEFFRMSEKPYSLHIATSMGMEGPANEENGGGEADVPF